MNHEDNKFNNTEIKDLQQSSDSINNSEDPVKKTKKKKTNRCVICKKKTGIMPFTCKCSSTNLYCSLHRLPEAHQCTFDWVKEGQERILKDNPVIKASLLNKIGE